MRWVARMRARGHQKLSIFLIVASPCGDQDTSNKSLLLQTRWTPYFIVRKLSSIVPLVQVAQLDSIMYKTTAEVHTPHLDLTKTKQQRQHLRPHRVHWSLGCCRECYSSNPDRRCWTGPRHPYTGKGLGWVKAPHTPGYCGGEWPRTQSAGKNSDEIRLQYLLLKWIKLFKCSLLR